MKIIKLVCILLITMKILTDASIFRQDSLRVQMEKEGCSYFGRKNLEWHHSTFLPQKPRNAMLWCSSIWEAKLKPGTHIRRINSNFLALEHIQKGSLWVRQNEEMFLAEENDFFLLRPGGDLEFMTGPTGFCIKEALILSGNLLGDILRCSGLDNKNYLPNVNVKKFESLLHSLKVSARQYHYGLLQELEHRAYDLILLLKEESVSEEIPDTLRELLMFMETNLDKQLSLQELARRYGCSISHLMRLFHMHYQTTPYKMLKELRMRRAVDLLLGTELSIKEIATMIGYEHPFNFSTEFKKTHKISPGFFRNSAPLP